MISPTAIPSIQTAASAVSAASAAGSPTASSAAGGGAASPAAAVVPSRMPSDTAFTQQRIRSWQPLLDPRYVIAAWLMIGIIFVPVGE